MATDTRLLPERAQERAQIAEEMRKAEPKSVPQLWALVRRLAELVGVRGGK